MEEKRPQHRTGDQKQNGHDEQGPPVHGGPPAVALQFRADRLFGPVVFADDRLARFFQCVVNDAHAKTPSSSRIDFLTISSEMLRSSLTNAVRSALLQTMLIS